MVFQSLIKIKENNLSSPAGAFFIDESSLSASISAHHMLYSHTSLKSVLKGMMATIEKGGLIAGTNLFNYSLVS